jgi:phosphatidylserine decarboxylase
MRLELAWGRCRRWYLKRFRPNFVARMQERRRGRPEGCPHEILDPRDLKFYRNVAACDWAPEDDPFRWRDRLPFARVGLGEVTLLGVGSLLAGGVLALVFWPVAVLAVLLALAVFWFFRNPRRVPPQGEGLVLSPADGHVASIEEIDDDYVGGPAVRIGIFLSVFDVHINRVPVSSRVIGVTYRPGKFLNAIRPRSARENEQLTVRLEEDCPPYRRFVVCQIAGAIARRIVCWLRPGDELSRGAQFGMIKFGSRTELILKREPGMAIEVRPGRKVHAGTTVLARYRF